MAGGQEDEQQDGGTGTGTTTPSSPDALVNAGVASAASSTPSGSSSSSSRRRRSAAMWTGSEERVHSHDDAALGSAPEAGFNANASGNTILQLGKGRAITVSTRRVQQLQQALSGIHSFLKPVLQHQQQQQHRQQQEQEQRPLPGSPSRPDREVQPEQLLQQQQQQPLLSPRSPSQLPPTPLHTLRLRIQRHLPPGSPGSALQEQREQQQGLDVQSTMVAPSAEQAQKQQQQQPHSQSQQEQHRQKQQQQAVVAAADAVRAASAAASAAAAEAMARSVDSAMLLRPKLQELQQRLQQLQQLPIRDMVEGLQTLAWGELLRGGSGGSGAGGQRRLVYPNLQRLSSVREFFLYTEAEGRRLFEELDFDCDGKVTLEDLEHAMRRRRLPKAYAKELLRRARRHWFARSFEWDEFKELMERTEPAMLRAFTSLALSSSGTLQKEQVLATLRKAGLPATEENARAMLSFLDADSSSSSSGNGDGSGGSGSMQARGMGGRGRRDSGAVTYGQFRNFLLLLPPERVTAADPSMVWFEAATVVPIMSPPVTTAHGGAAAAKASTATMLKSALAGGLVSGLSTCLMHPLDTIKTRVQASSATLKEVVSSVSVAGGIAGLYAGALPAIVGQFASHGLRTGTFEASKALLSAVKPDITEYQAQPIASLCSTVLGTVVRIPAEVLKQRLQAGLHGGSTREALRATLQADGVRGLFRGTTATLLREVPFYVFGMLIYLQVKRAARKVMGRELAPWEALLLGGVSGGLAAVAITPFDVIKTRIMVSSAVPSPAPAAVSVTGAAVGAVTAARKKGIGVLAGRVAYEASKQSTAGSAATAATANAAAAAGAEAAKSLGTKAAEKSAAVAADAVAKAAPAVVAAAARSAGVAASAGSGAGAGAVSALVTSTGAIAPPSDSLIDVGLHIVQTEGVGALYKGALPRFFWIAPLGAMNFAGYELARQAMDEEKVKK